MKNLYLVFLTLFYCFGLQAQTNLVKNPSFETFNTRGKGVTQIKHNGNQVSNWNASLNHNPDLYFIPNKSVAVANSGSCAVGIVLGGSKHSRTKYEYLTGELSQPLEKDKEYCISFSILLHRTSNWAATDVGILLHNDKKIVSHIDEPTTLTANLYLNESKPVTNTKWRTFNGYYRAAGGEKYLSFGKFGKNESVNLKDLGIESYFEMDGYQSQAYYQVDDFSVVKKTPEIDCGCAEPLPSIEEELENPIKRAPYLFAIDASGSMKSDHLFDSLRVSLMRFLRTVPVGSPVSFVTFSSSARKIWAGEVQENTVATIDSLLNRSPIGGGTNVFLGLQMSYQSWPTEVPDSAKLVFISDGEFRVTPKIVEIVKRNYDDYGRKLLLLQIGARASGLEELEPYLEGYIHTTASEIDQAVSQITSPVGLSGEMVDCGCEEDYSIVMNYHFVVDFSGSMAEEKSRAVSAVQYLFQKVPDNAFISLTTFNTRASQLYVGKKSDINMGSISAMLYGSPIGGGTDPTPGVQNALKMAERHALDRYSHLVLVTDLSAMVLSWKKELTASIQESGGKFDLSAGAIEVAADGLVTTRSEFDMLSGRFVGTSRTKFENDLFNTNRSSCDYTSQPYHYNLSKAAVKSGTKKFFGTVFMSLLKSQVTVN